MKKSAVIAIIALLTSIMCSCAMPFSRDKNGSGSATEGQSNYTSGGSATGYEKLQIVDSGEASADGQLDGGLDETIVTKTMESQRGRYCYDTMNTESQRLYAELYLIVKDHKEDIRVSTTDSDELTYAFQCMYNDHPEIFWVDGFTYTRHTKNDKIIYLTVSGRYIYSASECQQYQFKIDSYISRFLGGISQGASDYEKVKYTYEYVINNTDYDIDSSDNQNILSVFLYGKSVCQGYAKATQYLLGKLNVPCTLVVGSVVNTGEGHAWNLVNIGGSYYHLDATWGDSSYMGDGSSLSTINYNYLNVTSDEIMKTHSIKNVVPLPYCVATEANYFMKEGLYLLSYDAGAIRQMFNDAYRKGRSIVTFKCKDANVYAEVYNNLIEEQKIFDYLEGEVTNISYTNSDQDLIFTFWI